LLPFVVAGAVVILIAALSRAVPLEGEIHKGPRTVSAACLATRKLKFACSFHTGPRDLSDRLCRQNGKLQLRNDIYGRDKALLAILKSDERKIADTPIERKDNTVRQEALAVPNVGPNIFARLFGFTTA
jgi:hypothetical protein